MNDTTRGQLLARGFASELEKQAGKGKRLAEKLISPKKYYAKKADRLGQRAGRQAREAHEVRKRFPLGSAAADAVDDLATQNHLAAKLATKKSNSLRGLRGRIEAVTGRKL